MTDQHQGNIAIHWTNTFFNELRKYGVEHVVISPGSRSTPLTIAAASNPHLQKHVILDERSASFTALGIGKATNIPAVLICTSGTALANYYPAVIEARQSGVPMILTTADRPPNLRATGANQAIDQLHIFGNYPIFFHEVGEPKQREQDIERLKVLAQQAFSLSRELRGPAHLNFPFGKPLEPTVKKLNQMEKENWSKANAAVATSINPTFLLQNKITEAKRPLIINGPLAPADDTDSIAKLSEWLTAPVLSESSIGSPNTIRGFAGFLRNEDIRNQLAPDLILRFGFQPTTKSLELALKQWSPSHHIHFASTNAWQDATFSGANRIPWMGQKIHLGKAPTNTDTNWIKSWKQIENEFATYYQKTLEQYTELTDGSIYYHLSPQISEDHFIATSNSFPARDINLFGRQLLSIPLFLNRGASGIDGVTSTAIGLSLGIQKPGVLFTGDLAFLHDTNALLNQNKVEHPMVIVIINNFGGSIFRKLPVGQYDTYFESYFETPQSVDIEKLTNSYDIPCLEIDNLSKLDEFRLSDWTKEHQRFSVIECKTNADASMNLRKKLWAFN